MNLQIRSNVKDGGAKEICMKRKIYDGGEVLRSIGKDTKSSAINACLRCNRAVAAALIHIRLRE